MPEKETEYTSPPTVEAMIEAVRSLPNMRADYGVEDVTRLQKAGVITDDLRS